MPDKLKVWRMGDETFSCIAALMEVEVKAVRGEKKDGVVKAFSRGIYKSLHEELNGMDREAGLFSKLVEKVKRYIGETE